MVSDGLNVSPSLFLKPSAGIFELNLRWLK